MGVGDGAALEWATSASALLQDEDDGEVELASSPTNLLAHSGTAPCKGNVTDGTVFRLPVWDHAPLKVFWTPAGPRIEAALPHP